MRGRVRRVKLKSLLAQQYVTDKLKTGWSPEIIAGRMKFENALPNVCHEAIYHYIYKEMPSLIIYLPRQHRKRKKKHAYHKTVTVWGNRTSILERLEDINTRTSVGHWESDSIESKNRKCAVYVLVKRVSRLRHITKLWSKKALVTSNAICKRLSLYPPHFCKSVTYDNGSENMRYSNVEMALNIQSYFCQPYHSCEKGAVEQVNSLIRGY
ncbi:MAG: IS30 family transposase [Paraglaciecola sp.]|jgi:IS30 family transposase